MDLPHTRPNQIADFMEQIHSIFALVAPGHRPVTSARPSYLRAELIVSELPAEAEPGQTIPARIVVKNTGDTLWLCTPRDLGGYVTLGVKLCRPDRRVLSDTLGRTPLKQDVPPGSQITLETTIQLPEALESGEYLLLFDMVDEQVAWFEQTGSPVVERQITVRTQNSAGRSGQATPDYPASPATYRDLIQLAGRALAEMGVAEPTYELLEPLARTIHGFGVAANS